MKVSGIPDQLFDHFEVGISIVSWHPEDPELTEWIFVNEARCRMTGFTRDELLEHPPFSITTRETRAQVQKINAQIEKHGHFISESTLLHQSNKAIPVRLHMKRIRLAGANVLLTEFHDISSYKEAELRLELSRESTREMLTLIEKEKQNMSDNIENNFGLVLFPLIDQLRISATDQQKEVLDLIVKRIRNVSREIGIAGRVGSPGLNLTKRQALICEMIRDGMATKEIARVLDCAPSTINNHRNIIRRKLKIVGESANLQAFLNNPDGIDPKRHKK